MFRRALHITWGLYVGLLFAVVLTLAVLCAILLPTVRLRRDGSRSLAKVFFVLSGLPYTVRGAERLPKTQCVVVANHTSYIDGPLLYAALPSQFSFVIKKEIAGIPLAGWLLDRVGHELVERHNKAEGAKDARRILKAAFSGNSVAFFPEGTFSARPGLARFHSGAFVTAAKAGLPIVPVVVHGARQVLPAGVWLPQRVPMTIEILEPVEPPGPGETNGAARLRDEARRRMLERVGEPDLEEERIADSGSFGIREW
jgi:1-acyl-sn-glycerol-3-phosphate acyltransferase